MITLFFILLSVALCSYDFNETDWPSLCREGKRQSPVDLPSVSSSQVTESKEIRVTERMFSVVKTFTKEKLDKSTFKVNMRNEVRNQLKLTIEGQTKTFTLTEIGFKVPGEHTYERDRPAAEVQMHFEGEEKTNLVYTARFDGDSLEVNEFIEGFNFAGNQLNSSIDLGLVINEESNYYVYRGSKTVPDCSEDVLWLVSDTMQMSVTQFLEINNVVMSVYSKGNARMFRDNSSIQFNYVRNSAKYYVFSFVLVIFTIIL